MDKDYPRPGKGKAPGIDSLKGLEDALESYDPMRYDFRRSVSVADYVQEASRTQDIPCKFHDGVSGRCWKGAKCLYSHKIYTGGAFAAENPVWSAGANSVREVTSIVNLASEVPVNKFCRMTCEVTYVKSPSEFFIRVCQDGACECKLVKKSSDEKEVKKEGLDMDDYYYGFSALEEPEGLCIESTSSQPPAKTISRLISEKLTSFLVFGERYRNRQVDLYFPKIELVAARTDSQWHRAIVQKCNKNGTIDIQLLDTGEEITLEYSDICRLPVKFCDYPPEAIKCCLYGVSPVFMGRWNNDATKKFREYVKEKKVKIVIKNRSFKNGKFSILEDYPYFVEVITEMDQDVAAELVTHGLANKWNHTQK